MYNSNSNSYRYQNDVSNTIGVFYLVFGIGCIAFFLFGVCALLCCCRSRFRGLERKGFVIRDVEQRPLVVNNPVVITGPPYPAQAPQEYPPAGPPQNVYNPPQAPPPYEMPEKY